MGNIKKTKDFQFVQVAPLRYEVRMKGNYSNYIIKKEIVKFMNRFPIVKVKFLYQKPHVEMELGTGSKVLFILYQVIESEVKDGN